MGKQRRTLRAGRAGATQLGLLPPQGWRRNQSFVDGSSQPQRRSLPHTYPTERPPYAAAVRGADEHNGATRRARVETDPGRSCEIQDVSLTPYHAEGQGSAHFLGDGQTNPE